MFFLFYTSELKKPVFQQVQSKKASFLTPSALRRLLCVRVFAPLGIFLFLFRSLDLDIIKITFIVPVSYEPGCHYRSQIT